MTCIRNKQITEFQFDKAVKIKPSLRQIDGSLRPISWNLSLLITSFKKQVHSSLERRYSSVRPRKQTKRLPVKARVNLFPRNKDGFFF